MARFDTVIKGGTVIDGRRNPRVRSDVGIKDGRVAGFGRLSASDADHVLDADGLIVAPGFVDLHTHYDSQLFWDPYCTVSGYHGVTSVVIGNCGYSFAPVRPAEREAAMMMFTRVEQISYESMQATLPWTWESFPQFLDAVDALPKGVNVLPYVGVNPLLTYVMGHEAAKSRHATAEENAAVGRLLGEAVDAGACGWSALRCPADSYSSVHRDHDATSFPSDVMSHDTAFALGGALAERNTGFMQIMMVSNDPVDDVTHLEELARTSGRPIIWNTLVIDGNDPDRHRMGMAWFDSCRERGLPLYCQATTTDVSMPFTLDIWNLWDANPAWAEALMGGRQERIAKLSDPGMRERLRKEDVVLYPLHLTTLVETGNPAYREYTGQRVPQIAQALGKDPVDALLDISLSEDLRTMWRADLLEQNSDLLREIVQHPWMIPGVSDGGAHTKMITSGRFPTEHIETFVREYGWVSLEEMHWKLSALPAHVAGFAGRGTLTLGAPADIVVYDYATLRSLPEEVAHDVPGGDWRRTRKAEGYRYIVVNGQVTFDDGRPTGTTPGRLLRHGG
ncbi:N-acyl-D-amino-acid deacylase family protein [Actinomadura rubrisoli]|uniref:Aminoacylase n=1 Tax=Actinomadura rubrisoli TaxID=2530368 RepID=A0A4R5CGE8_9ACTN|nr:amidohydrolase family protein [Actinomadura rubrisoli]TDD98129.1 aminoacylase [Actinomadura rubrisoli]